MMLRFRNFLHEHGLKELYLHVRIFTWSNERERERPMLTRIDCALVSVDWDLTHQDSMIQTLSSLVLDHVQYTLL
jgi:hypothetical protein